MYSCYSIMQYAVHGFIFIRSGRDLDSRVSDEMPINKLLHCSLIITLVSHGSQEVTCSEVVVK